MMKLFIWRIEDTFVEQGIAIGFADSEGEAIGRICEAAKPQHREVLRAELQSQDPEIRQPPCGLFLISAT